MYNVYKNKDEDNSSKTLNNKNHQASSQKFKQLVQCQVLGRYLLNLDPFIALKESESESIPDTFVIPKDNCQETGQ